MLPASVRRRAAVVLAVSGVLLLNACGGAQARKAKHFEKGQTYLADGNFEKARVEFQNALQIAPTDPEARFEMGVVDEKLLKIREAAQFYQGVIDVSPDHLGARTHLARLFVLSGAPDRAMDVMKPAIEKHPDNSELLTLRAAVHVQQQDLTAALPDAERAVQLDPRNEEAIATLAGIYSANKSFDKAQTLLEEAIVRIPTSVDLRIVLTQVYANQNRPADAERVLTELVKLRPEEKSHRIRLAQYYAGLGKLDEAEQALREGVKSNPSDREMKLLLIDFLANRRGNDAAEKQLKSFVAAEPTDFELKFALAKFYVATRRANLAEALYREVIDSEKLDSAGLAARDRLAELRAQQNDAAGAEKLIAEVLAKSPRDDDALVLRGDIALAKQDPKSAIADLRAVLRDQPNSIPVLRTLARAHVANGEPAVAEDTMRRAVEANPKDAGVRLDLAQLLAQLGKPEEAKPFLTDLVRDQPTNVPALVTLFQVCAVTKDYTAAKMAADALVATNPKAAVGYLYQGIVAEQNKQTDQALHLYGQAADLQPDTVEPLEAQIRLLTIANRVPEALKRLDEVVARDPLSPLALKLKGDLLAGQHRYADAQQAYNLAIARTPKWGPSYQGLARAQFAANQPEAALATLHKGEEVAEQSEPLSVEVGAYYERRGMVDEAIKQYEALLARAPHADIAANNLAMLLATRKSDPASLDRAKALAARFAESPNMAFLDTYGWVLFKHGEAAASVSVLERVVAKQPNAAEARYHLGMALAQAGSSAAARENLTRAVDSGVKFPGLDEAKATLEKLAQLQSGATPKT